MVIEKNKTYQLLNSNGLLDNSEAEYLEKLTRRYPFFQAAYAAYLLHLKQTDEIKYKKFLPKTAAVTTDRTYLFDIANGYAEIPVNEMTEDVAKDEKSAAPPVTTPSREQPSETDITGIRNKQLSYLEWVKLFSKKNGETSGQKPGTNKKMELIDRFLTAQPKIKPRKDYNPGPLPEAEASLRENAMLMTETLANLYIKQGKYDKATQAFEILKLKYPEKNRYFATRILEIKSLKDRKKS